MIVIHKIKTLFTNIVQIYDCNYSPRKLLWVIASSIPLIPLYLSFIIFLVSINVLLLILFLPFYIIKALSGNTYGMDDPIMSIVLLPLSIGYFSAYFFTFIPYIIVGFLCDAIAEIISFKKHNVDYVIVWPSVLAAPHKEAYPPRWGY